MSGRLHQIDIGGQLVWVEMQDAVATPAQADRRFEATSAGSLVQSATAAVTSVDLAPTLHAVVGQVRAALASFAAEEISVELALGFKADIGVFIASGEASAQIKVSAKWKPMPPGGAPARS